MDSVVSATKTKMFVYRWLVRRVLAPALASFTHCGKAFLEALRMKTGGMEKEM